jgi:hypothetical protein
VHTNHRVRLDVLASSFLAIVLCCKLFLPGFQVIAKGIAALLKLCYAHRDNVCRSRCWFNDDVEGRIEDRGARRARAKAKQGSSALLHANHFNEPMSLSSCQRPCI